MSEIPLNKLQTARQGLVIPSVPGFVLGLAFLLTFGILFLMMSLMVSFRLGDTMARHNPFDNFQLLWPGQTLADVAEYARRTPNGHVTCSANAPALNLYPGLLILTIPDTNMGYGSSQPMTCMDNLEQGPFRSVSITIKNERIQELNLFSDFLQQDVLAVYWGVPDAITKGQNGQSLYLHWDRSTYEATAMLTQPYLVVSLVTLRAK